MLTSLIVTICIVSDQMQLGLFDVVRTVWHSEYSQIAECSDWASPYHFLKYFLTGAFIPIVMTGLDQDMMQKNLACRTLQHAKRNMIAYGYGFLPVNLLLLTLGVLLALYMGQQGMALPPRGDALYPMVASGGYLGGWVAFLFVLGIIAATFSSADSALTALTTSFTLDILRIPLDQARRVRRVSAWVHAALALVVVLCIMALHWLGTQSAISTLFAAIGYTYGPLLGLFAFSLFTPWRSREGWVPFLAIVSPLASYALKVALAEWTGYSTGYELLVLNGAIMFLGLYCTRLRTDGKEVCSC